MPYQQKNEPRELVREFYEKDNMFSLTNDTLKQLRTVYKVNDKFEIQFATSFFVIELDRCLITYLDVIKAQESKKGFGRQFINDIVEFLAACLEENKELKGAHLLVGQSQLLKPHNFFSKQGFSPLPKQLGDLKLEGSDLAYRRVSRTLEEEKGANNKRD